MRRSDCELVLLNNPWQRAWGAMFRRRLGNQLLAFVYPHPAPRLFHTFGCPPLRLLALDAAGNIVFDQLVSPGRFVKLPPARFILEIDPDQVLPPVGVLLPVLRACREALPGALAENVALDRLLFGLVAQAMGDLRRVYQVHGWSACVSPQVLRAKFAFWERGQICASAGFLLDFKDLYSLPSKAIRLARQLLEVERPILAELLAASVAGRPWKLDFPPGCLRCRAPASWRPALSAPANLAPETAWRYERPENAVPLCHRCAYLLQWSRREWLRVDLAWGLWGARFEAFWRWHEAAGEGRLPPDWDRQSHPLWPRLYGGPTWESGSGALQDTAPRPPTELPLTPERREIMMLALNSRAGSRSADLAGLPTALFTHRLLTDRPVQSGAAASLNY